MTAAAIEVQKAVFSALAGDAALSAVLGGARVYDYAPAHAPFPYITFGRSSSSDWSTASEDGAEHLFTVHVWSRARGRREVAALMELVRGRLHDADLALAGHVLVNLRHGFDDIRYDDDHDVYHGAMQFRAVTEPAG